MSKKRTQKKEFAHIGGVLAEVLGGFRKRPEGDMTELWERWAAAVGPAVAENARPAAVKGKELVVNVSSSAWMQQLQFLKADLIAKLNRALGEERVSDIRFRVGPLGR
jgi:predicted nucleic acid-binding Zn ribbon protein